MTPTLAHGQVWKDPADGQNPLRRNRDMIIRIIACNESEVFYDVWYESNNRWSYARRKSLAYFRMFVANMHPMTWVRDEPLSEKERALHRPDLPFETCQTENWQWNRISFRTEQEFRDALLTGGARIETLESLEPIRAPRLALLASGVQGGVHAVGVVEADDGERFRPLELLWKAHNSQVHLKSGATSGVGIYRSGITQGIPSYYLGNSLSAAELLFREFASRRTSQ